MKYRELGKTGLKVSEIGLGAEWLVRHDLSEIKTIITCCQEAGINILDCWMSDPMVRTNIGKALKGDREQWLIQGHLGSTWQNGQYVKTREMPIVITAFRDLLERLETDYIDLGMIHFVDETVEFERIMNGEFYEYAADLKKKGVIRHLGLSTHNPKVGKMAVLSGKIEMIMFSVNPAFDLLPATEDVNCYFAEAYDESLRGIDPERDELYRICERQGIGLNVMKGYAGGRLFDAKISPFGVALTPIQCLHYALTRPAAASVLVGVDNPEQIRQAVSYETASEEEKDYASVLAGAPRHAYSGQCTYCGHCAPCPSGIDIAMVNKLLDLAQMQENVPDTVRAHCLSLSKNASDCLACGACEKRCPFHVPVVDRMKLAQKIFQ